MKLLKTPTLCLNMIVKNESNIITRLFDSVISIIDTYCICDTGSTDNTIQIIEEYFVKKGINGKIIQEPFKNFCYNRNFALKECIGLADFVLLLDADMILKLNNFEKSMLSKADSFSILQGNEAFYYQNLRIIKNNGLYKYIGVTHEYIDTPSNNNSIFLDKSVIFIIDIGDGGSKSDKFQRDIRLLIEGLKHEPNNARYHFYLANSYHDNGNFEEAIKFYKKRIELEDWKEEVWYSYYRIGCCYKKMNNFSDALHYWLEGYNFYPERLEAIYEIIKYYRKNSKHQLCMVFYNVAKNILNKKLNRDSYLFLHNDIYLHKIYYEYTIFAYYCGIININDETILVLNNSDIYSNINNLLSNMKFYKDILQKTMLFSFDKTIQLVINGENITFYSSNNCLIKNPNKDGYLLNVRYVNYYIEPNGHYIGCDKHIISTNNLLELDDKFNIVREQFMELIFDGRPYMELKM